MDEKNFKKHLRDLLRGKHNTPEHAAAPNRVSGDAKPKKATGKRARHA